MITEEVHADSPLAVWDEIVDERARAHAKHGPTSMEASPWHAHHRCTILTEEVGEVAAALNDLHALPSGVLALEDSVMADCRVLQAKLRAELIQVAAMAVAWVEAIDGWPLP